MTLLAVSNRFVVFALTTYHVEKVCPDGRDATARVTVLRLLASDTEGPRLTTGSQKGIEPLPVELVLELYGISEETTTLLAS